MKKEEIIYNKAVDIVRQSSKMAKIPAVKMKQILLSGEISTNEDNCA